MDLFAKLHEIQARHHKDVPSLAALKSDAEGVLYIYQAIGDSIFNGITAVQVKDALAGMKNIKRLTLFVNSVGGSYFEAKAIMAQLQRFKEKAEVVAVVDGLAASAASLLIMAAHKIVMGESSTMMVHRPHAAAAGDADDFAAMADLLRMETDTLVDIYAKRTGLSTEKIAAMLEAETWLDAKQAVELHFADETAASEDDEKLAAKAMPKVAALVNETRKHIQDARVSKMDMRTLKTK